MFYGQMATTHAAVKMRLIKKSYHLNLYQTT